MKRSHFKERLVHSLIFGTQVMKRIHSSWASGGLNLSEEALKDQLVNKSAEDILDFLERDFKRSGKPLWGDEDE